VGYIFGASAKGVDYIFAMHVTIDCVVGKALNKT